MNSRMIPRGTISAGTRQAYEYNPGPNAALLIDFDNVTMAIRSDLGKELKALLRSDVIRGKVAVQRAYADWRRYPQYIVPLTESSVDLIFAPAYGSSKKNATDLRMAIDAIELVFTRPEIGTFILMTGDSDFSSCVLKLKEYGKYVIGVGMRESSSDLLIQNCDEYYSYHSISGLTRAGEVQESKEDPWVLVRRAVQQMVKDGDVMRTDRLKQVMIDLDPAFDEKKLGYSKFSRFVSEAAAKGVLRVRKTEAGQHEIVTDGEPEPREKVVERIVAEAEAGANGRRRGRGRGGRDERRESRPREERAATEAPAEASREKAESAEPPVTEKAEASAPAPAPAAEADAAAEATESRQSEAPAAAESAAPATLDWAYSLLQEAVRRLTSRDGKSVRDGDVKRRMLEISRDFDEGQLGFSKFTRFLRQAHDAEVIDLNRAGAGNYEVSLPAGGKRLPPPRTVVPGEPSAPEREERPREGKGQREEKAPAKTSRKAAAEAPARASESEPRQAETPKPSEATPARAEAGPAEPAVGVGGMRGRRGGRAPLSGPPPILPGQAIAPPGTAAEAPRTEAQAAEPAPAEDESAAAAEAKPSRSRSRRGRGGRGARATPPAAETGGDAGTPEASPVEAEETPAPKPRSRRGSRAKSARTKPAAAATTESVAERLDLPRTTREIVKHLSSYKGVGIKTAEAMVEKFGEDVFEALESRQDEVRALLGDRRAGTLLEQWGADRDARAAAASGQPTSPGADEAGAAAPAKPSGGRGRRGGRGRTGRGKEPASSS